MLLRPPSVEGTYPRPTTTAASLATTTEVTHVTTTTILTAVATTSVSGVATTTTASTLQVWQQRQHQPQHQVCVCEVCVALRTVAVK